MRRIAVKNGVVSHEVRDVLASSGGVWVLIRREGIKTRWPDNIEL